MNDTIVMIQYIHSFLFCSPRTGNVSDIMKEHNGTVRVVKFNLTNSTSGIFVASAGAGDCKPRLWDAETGNLL